MVLPFLRKRSKIIEIVAARDMVFALAQSGVCAAFSQGIARLSTSVLILDFICIKKWDGGVLMCSYCWMQRPTKGYAF
jgi:hypothetical protein